MIYRWDNEALPMEDRLAAAKLEVDSLWSTLHDIAHYNVNDDIAHVQRMAIQKITDGATLSKADAPWCSNGAVPFAGTLSMQMVTHGTPLRDITYSATLPKARDE